MNLLNGWKSWIATALLIVSTCAPQVLDVLNIPSGEGTIGALILLVIGLVHKELKTKKLIKTVSELKK